ncbi:hypothetical protein Gorai_013295 [Gossypium raimondii]|uniref:DUF4283 domain-containing protein n=1 Tax=Gossypium raimondii TaxID=29730 RepID=A0A7J8Q4P0_GOSRA|nr:hypothetical protein [Gossypium raimondii]
MLGKGNGADLIMSTSEGNGVETHTLANQITKKTVSYKDRLVGKGQSGSKKTTEFLVSEGDDDFEFCEGDIRKSTINGIPAIKFSERIHQFLIRDMSTMLVLKLLGRNIAFRGISTREKYPGRLGMIGRVAKLDFNTNTKMDVKVISMRLVLESGARRNWSNKTLNLKRLRWWGSRFSTLVSLDKDEEVIADDGEKSKGFKSKGYEIIVNFNLGVSNKGGSTAVRLTRELGSKFSQVGHVKVDGLPGSMDSDNFVDGSEISGWIGTSSSMSLSNLSVLESAPN